MIYRASHVLFAAVGIMLFVAAVSVLTWLGNTADRAAEFWDSWGGLVVQLVFWLAGIALAAYLVLRLVALVLRSAKKGSRP